MTLHRLREPPPPWLGEAPERFEQQFRYPLGADATFRISHGRDYLPFFQTIGEATVFVAERNGEVLGTLAGIQRPLRLPSGEVQLATYLCDLKIAPGARHGRTLLLLARALEADARAAGSTCGYSVVMDGTRQTPMDYTGRCDIPGFSVAGELMVLKIAVPAEPEANPPSAREPNPEVQPASLAEVDAAFQDLAGPAIIPLGGSPHLRSAMEPMPLLTRDATACGIVEDTRRGKRLITDTGAEMSAAHLSRFAYATPEHGVTLLRAALTIACQAGFPALFVSLPRHTTPAFRPLLAGLSIVEAPATIYATGLASPGDWCIHTSEI